MRTMFYSKICINKNVPSYNARMLKKGKDIYLNFLSLANRMVDINDAKYLSIPDMYDLLNIRSTHMHSKRKLYENYTSGVIVGAGSGSDCDTLLGNDNFVLVDLEDVRMHNFALGYEHKMADFNSTESPDGSTLTKVKDEYCKEVKKIQVRTIDSLHLKECGIISIDAEGLGIDVLSGATKTIYDLKPDILISIYHNWIEYSFAIPILYDAGYTISCIRGTNPIPNQPHLELELFATYEGK